MSFKNSLTMTHYIDPKPGKKIKTFSGQSKNTKVWVKESCFPENEIINFKTNCNIVLQSLIYFKHQKQHGEGNIITLIIIFLHHISTVCLPQV